jgi:hypothetical protein
LPEADEKQKTEILFRERASILIVTAEYLNIFQSLHLSLASTLSIRRQCLFVDYDEDLLAKILIRVHHELKRMMVEFDIRRPSNESGVHHDICHVGTVRTSAG